ncbi:MAG: NAD(P)/FAD-dependent oxidoreductase [Hyphomicrobiales bacterium]|nr:NAD(P)/FAD-dependent oxidoreductase [Hyphomicrobiales bacterium]
MSQSAIFDLIVLGTGTAGSSVARRCRRAGWSVAIVDTGAFGGTCALRGCEPKKVLWTIANAADQARRLATVGLPGCRDATLDWEALQRFKRSFTDPVPERMATEFRSLGIEALRGAPRFVSRDAVEIDSRRLTARHFVIATGARPTTLPIKGRELLVTSDDFLALDALPRRLLLIGGGYIGFEIAHIARRGGADVVILHEDGRPLSGFDRVLVDRLIDECKRVGIAVELQAEVKAIERCGDGFHVMARRSGKKASWEGDLAIHAAGRVPNLDNLALDAAEVERDGRRLKLDQHLRSVSNPLVFAAGDAAQAGPPLTPVATIDAEIVAGNLLDAGTREPNYRGVPSGVFSIPPLVRVGLTEEEAQEQKLDFDIHEGDMSDFQSIRRLRHEAAAYRILIERRTERLLGAHLLGPSAEEVINLFGLAIRLGIGADKLRQLVSCYPSFASNVTEMIG